MNEEHTTSSQRLFLSGFLLMNALLFGELPRATTLPAVCKSLYPKLLPQEGRPLNQKEIEELLHFARLSPEAMSESLKKLGVRPARSFLEKLMLLRFQIRSLPLRSLPQELRPHLSEILTAFPKTQTHLELLNKNQEKLAQRLLQDRMDLALQRVAEHLGSESTPEEQLDTFKYFLSTLDSYDASWLHQTHLDSLIDRASGFHIQQISQEIQKQDRQRFNDKHEGEETYSFAGPALLLTPYTEILNVFRSLGLKPSMHVVDLGAGFGRVGLALAAREPSVSFTGYEIVPERIQEGQRIAKDWQLADRLKLLEKNMADPHFLPEPADIYFAFNPVSGSTFDKILEDLRRVGLKSGKRFRLVLFGPSPFEKADAQPWLKASSNPEIPKGEDLKVYEFVPEKASHTEIVTPSRRNPYELRSSSEEKDLLFDSLSSFLSPNYFKAWSQTVPFEKSEFGGLKLLSTRSNSQEVYLEPIGGSAQEKAQVISKLIQLKGLQGISVTFTHLSESVKEALSNTTGLKVEWDPNHSDYIYRLRDLSELTSTKPLRDRSRQAAQFQEAQPDREIQVLSELNPEDKSRFIKSAQHFLKEWREKRLSQFTGTEQERSELLSESAASEVLSSELTGKGTVQILLRSSPQSPVIAYASGEIRPGPEGKRMLVLYVQKADGTKNAISFLNQALAKEVLSHPERYGEVEYMNMMDAAVPGLKQFKKQYGPLPQLGRVYRATANPEIQ